jgi:hypothetical protein
MLIFSATGFTRTVDGEYAVSRIAPALLKNADAVLRLVEMTFEIKSTKETIERNHYVVTVLNENGDKWARFYDYYDKMREVLSVEGALYDATGKVIRRMKNKDLQDMSGVDEISWIDDNRIKTHNFFYRVYPYTVEYDVLIRNNNTLYFPTWMPQGSEKLSVELSKISIICSPGYRFRYRSFNYKDDPVITTLNGKSISTWMAKDLPAIKREIYSPEWEELVTCVYFGPTDFEIDGYKGNMASWQDMGKFQYTLNQGRDLLPDKVKQDIHNLVSGITEVKKKIQVLYEYLQKNTRYISIQLGIGGWQPFDATYVATKGYGDCKALSNYMYSLLKEAGIPSNYTLIRAGMDAGGMIVDFPSCQFNHAILSVPLEKDTVWLECTSQYLPAGYLSGFTADRYALVVDENGGKVVHTPKYGMEDNVQLRKVKAVLDDEATLFVKTESVYKGLQQDNLHQVINYRSKDKVKEFLHEELDFATYDVNGFEYQEEKSYHPCISEKLELTVSNYATLTGKRLFIQPNVMNRSTLRLAANDERKTDVILRLEYKDVDSVEISIPGGYEPESIPTPIDINTAFGKYSVSVKFSGNRITYYRVMEQYSGRFPAKDFSSLAAFYESIYKADRNKIVLVKKEETPATKPF